MLILARSPALDARPHGKKHSTAPKTTTVQGTVANSGGFLYIMITDDGRGPATGARLEYKFLAGPQWLAAEKLQTGHCFELPWDGSNAIQTVILRVGSNTAMPEERTVGIRYPKSYMNVDNPYIAYVGLDPPAPSWAPPSCRPQESTPKSLLADSRAVKP